MRLKLLIADDHQLMLAAIHLALDDAPDFEIVGEAHSGSQLLPLVGQISPDVILLDQRHPEVKTIVLSGTDDPGAIQASFDRGALAFIQKNIEPADLPAVIRQALAGNVHYAVNGAVAAAAQPDWDLTPRETEILRALAEGQSNKQMAQQFWLSEQTIKYHLTNVYRKLAVSSRTEAVRKAYEHGLIENPVLRMTIASG